MTDEGILRQAKELKEYVIDCRRKIHQYAEVSGTEKKTSTFIQSEMESMGLPWEMVSKTGLIATLETGRPGPHIALRADIDALPVHEEPDNLIRPRACVSDNPETSHACGHDAHAAMLLGTMKALVKNQKDITGTYYFCFEEGEENGGGNPPDDKCVGKTQSRCSLGNSRLCRIAVRKNMCKSGPQNGRGSRNRY